MAETEGSSSKGKWRSKFERLRARQENAQEREHEATGLVLDHGAAYVGGSIVAFLNGRRGGMPAIAKIPIDVISAGVATLTGLGLVMTGRSWGRHVAALGLGPGIWWLGGIIAKWGQKKRREAGEMLSQYDANGNLLSVRVMTDAEADNAGVQQRPPITAGASQSQLAGQSQLAAIFEAVRKAA